MSLTRVSPMLQRSCSCGGTPGPTGECAECRAKRLQRQATGAGPAVAPPIVNAVLRSPGRPLDGATRAFMEPRFGHDFSRVRIHTDARADESARAVDAAAYTVGSSIVFASGRYDTRTADGKRLVAHELTHVIQQQSSTQPSGAIRVGRAGDRAEHEAAGIADGILAGAAVQPSTGPSLLRRQSASGGSPGMRLPTNIRRLDPAEITIGASVYGGSIEWSDVYVTDALGTSGRPFTLLTPGLGTVINAGPSFYRTPGSDRTTLVHELAHSWQSQHHFNHAQYMVNSIESQGLAGATGGSSYCYVPGKAFGLYGAEQIARQVDRGVSTIVSHMRGASAGSIDPENLLSLAVPHWETPGGPGVVC